MGLGILGRKIGMMQWFDEHGNGIPATVIQAEPNVVTQIKTEETDGYVALQVGFEKAKEQRVNQPMTGHFKKAGTDLQRNLKEFRIADASEYQVGQKISVDIFEDGEIIRVAGLSKGKGFAGVMKRHKFHGGPQTHGGDNQRGPGSIGNLTASGKVFRGKKMAGHMGYERVSIDGLTVLKSDPERNLVVVLGSVPGPRGGLLELSKNA
jgi:large subunit ribosomal protein L3